MHLCMGDLLVSSGIVSGGSSRSDGSAVKVHFDSLELCDGWDVQFIPLHSYVGRRLLIIINPLTTLMKGLKLKRLSPLESRA